jgi:hypothetical protein
MKETPLPLVRRADEVHIAADRVTWREIVSRLSAQAPAEACAFVLTRPSIGALRTTVIIRDVIWARVGEVVATPRALEISAD